MKDNKGFTLIELIVTISLLSIIAVISFVSINGIIGRSKDTNCENLKKNIENAVKEYVSDNRYSENNLVNSTDIQNLISNKYLNGPIIDPYDSDTEITSSSIVVSWELNNDYTLKKIISIKYNSKEITCNGHLVD